MEKVCNLIQDLLEYAIDKSLIDPLDRVFYANRLMSALGVDSYEPDADPSSEIDLEVLLGKLCDYAICIARGKRGSTECKRLQRIAGKDGVRLAELRPDRRPTSALRVVVHRRKIVVHERVAVQQLNCARRVYGIISLSTYSGSRRKAYLRTHTLATGHHSMAHSVEKRFGTRP